MDIAIKATEQFLNDLRRDVGDLNFDRLLTISPGEMERQLALDALSKGKRFRFFTPRLSARVKEDDRVLTKSKQFFRKLLKAIQSVITGRIFKDDSVYQPTYDLSDQGINVTDVNNFRAAPYILDKEL